MNNATYSNYNGGNQNYTTIAQNAVNSWNSAGTDAGWTNQGLGPYISLFNTNRNNDGKVGLTIYSCSGGYFTGTPYSTWNEYYTYDETSTFNRAVMIHEMGHSAGLSHPSVCNDPKNGGAIMASATCYSTPQADDKNGINVLY